MPQLFETLDEKDGWYRVKETDSERPGAGADHNVLQVNEYDLNSLHFVFKGKSLCGADVPDDALRDNVPGENCKKCFQRHRNLFNSDNPEDAYKDL